jgi:uncharacterized membrane protein YphA (DoxX/SURF4 family)
MKYIPHVLRTLLGLLFCLSGSNGLFDYLPRPEKLPDFAVALYKTGYMVQLIGATSLLAGVLMVINRFVPFALVILAPIIVNILAFHLFLDRGGLIVAIIVTAIEAYLMWAYRDAYRSVLVMRAKPRAI